MTDLTGKKVLPTKVLFRKLERETKLTAGGIIIPDNAEDAIKVGEIVLVGSGTEAVPMPLKTGDKILYPPRAPLRVKLEDDELWLLNVTDVMLYW